MPLAGTWRPLTTSMGVWLMFRSWASLTEASTAAPDSAGRAAGLDLGRVQTSLGDGAVQCEGGAIGGVEAFLAIKDGCGEGEEGAAAALLGHANAIGSGGLAAGWMLANGIALEDDAGLGKIDGELVHVGLGFLAMGALEVSELDQFQILGGGAAIGAVGALLQLGAMIGVRDARRRG